MTLCCASPAIIFIIILNFQTVFSSEVIFDRVELINGTYVEGIYNASLCKVRKINRFTYAINLDLIQLMDFDEKVEAAVVFYYNQYNNNEYNLSPIRIKRRKLCDMWKHYSKLVITPKNKYTTNMGDPNVFCPLKKVIYSLTQAK